MVVAVSFSQICFLAWENVFFFLFLVCWVFLNYKKVLNFCISWDDYMIFLFSFTNVIYYIDFFEC